MNETLLPIHRSFTEKELLEWSKKQLQELTLKFDELNSKYNVLKIKNESLKSQLKEYDLQFGSTINGSKTVSARAYNRLMKRFKQMEQTFWNEHTELMKLKNKDEKF